VSAADIDPELASAARAWMEQDPDEETRAELRELLDRGDAVTLHERFDVPLTFGTAGLRGVVGAGPGAMNRLVVRRTAAGVADWVLAKGAGAPEAGIVVGRDARRGSEAFARDTAEVASRAGVAVHAFARPLPTPITAFAVRELHASAGVVVTASHNPARDNGYKVYDADGSQIIAPADQLIEAASRRLADEPAAPAASPGSITEIDEDALLATYRDRVLALVDPEGPRDLSVVYTPMHGVGGAVTPALLEQAGFTVLQVPEQAAPDPTFPTVAFPNPEEPGALDLALALAASTGADLVVANDPDADRLCVAVVDHGRWRALSGDELGALLGDHLCSVTDGPDRLVATTIVSSSMLQAIAASHGVAFTQTLTGFKWLARAALGTDRRLVFAYEEALGYAVSDAVRDKDGMSAAVVACALAAAHKARGTTLLDALDSLAARHGVHLTAQVSVRREGVDGPAQIARIVGSFRTAPPAALGGIAVTEAADLALGFGGLPPTEGILLRAGSAVRVVVRPSGTEPKLKAYIEVATAPPGRDGLEAARRSAGELLAAVRGEIAARCGDG
jgi:phosphomannomutase